jgi:hypothetical protein
MFVSISLIILIFCVDGPLHKVIVLTLCNASSRQS